MATVVRPGPLDHSVLRLQHSHRSEDVWNHGDDRVLSFREHIFGLTRDWVVDDRMLAYIRRAGLFCIHRLAGGGFELDRSLRTALVERWRQETHTFHLVVGEATITLQDVAVLLGLRVHGQPVTGPSVEDWGGVVEELLGARPGVDEQTQKPFLHGSTLKMKWLRSQFSRLPEGADDLVVQRHNQAYILALMATILFSDKSGDAVSLYYLPLLRDWDVASSCSWGAATLAFLYRQLCRACKGGAREIGGALILMQLWSWEHICIGRLDIWRPRDMRLWDPHEIDLDPILGSQHMRGVDSLACSWMRVRFAVAHMAIGLPYY